MLLGHIMTMSVTLAEDVDKNSSNTIEISDDDTEYVLVEDNELSLNDINSTNTNLSTQKKRSIKMIVGGSSEDGLAKRVTLPVNN